ncbi:MAG: aldo/keto reductase [Pseudomonadota bacterium]
MTQIGFGISGPLAAPWFSSRKARRVIDAALDAGIRTFDCGSFYGDGLGESRLGEALKGASDDVVVFSKTGSPREEEKNWRKDFSEEKVRADVEGSLRRLKRDFLDILYLHGPNKHEFEVGCASLEALKSEGLIKAGGICCDADVARKVYSPAFDAIMAPINFLDQRASATLRQAKDDNLHTTAIAPLAQGVYEVGYGRVLSLSSFWRNARARAKTPDLFNQRLEIADRIRGATERRPLSKAALGFVLAEPTIDLAVFTSTNAKRVAALASTEPLPPGEAEALRAVGDDMKIFA